MERIIVLDTETTGVTPSDRIVELAWIEIDQNLEEVGRFQTLVDPEMLISPSAMGVHHITDADVESAPTIEEVFAVVRPKEFEGQGVVMVAHNCVTGDHEVRTRDGWVRLDELSDECEVLQWDSNSGALVFVKPVVIRHRYTGGMLKWDTRYHKGIYTPDHRIYYKGTQGAEASWRVTTASEFSLKGPNSVAIPVSGVLEAENSIQLSEVEARALEMIRADGHIARKKGSHKHSVRLKFKKDRKISRCLAILDLLQVSYHIWKDSAGATSIRLYCDETTERIASLLGEGKNKAYGSWVLDLSVKSRAAILDELKYWDGSSGDGANSSTIIHSSKRSDIHFICEMAILTGMTATVKYDIPNTRGFSRSDGVIHSVTVRNRSQIKTLETPIAVEFDGTVYCLNVQSGAFLIRRQGVTWVTGNCDFDHRYVQDHVPVKECVCTLRLARHFWPDAPDHRLQTLRYLHKLKGGVGAHGALEDCETTLALLRHICAEQKIGLEWVRRLCRGTLRVHRIPFGKHRGSKISELPRGYKVWLLGTDLDPDLRAAVIASLK